MTVARLILGVVLTYVFVQLIKVTYGSIKAKRWHWNILLLPGGMPSLHSAFVTSLVTGLYLTEGLTSLSVVATVFAVIVIYDAFTLRREVGFQKGVLDKLHLKIEKHAAKTFLEKENIGHTPAEVITGILLGILGPVVIYALTLPW